MQSLDAISGLIQEGDLALVEVDITRFTKSTEPVILQWQNPSVRKIYMVSTDAQRLSLEHPDWLDMQCVDVAMLAACHVAPVPERLTIGHFYVNLTRNPELWTYLVEKLNQHFPHLKGANNTEFLRQIIDLSVDYLTRHPLELEHLPSEVLAQIQEMAKRKASQSLLSAE